MKTRLLVGVLALFAFTGCAKKKHEAVKAAEAMADKICACKDAECVLKLVEEAKNMESDTKESGKLNESQLKELEAAKEKAKNCAKDILTK